MFTVTKKFYSDYRIKGSKFLGFIFPASTKTDVEYALGMIRSEHPTATHHCYAYRINPHEPIELSNDDGEPGGTAGLPILNSIRSHNPMNVVLIVVRYYGGTKLGRSGLIEAYGHSANLTTEHSDLKKLLPVTLYRIKYGYEHQGIIDKLKNDFTWIELKSTYLEKVELEFGCPVSEAQKFLAKLKSLEHLFDDVEVLGNSFHIIR